MDWYPLYNSLRIAAISTVAVFLLGIFAAVCTVGIIIVGYFFNAIQNFMI